MRRIAVLDAPSNLGLRPPTATSVPGCAKAPGALRDHGLLRRLNARDAGCLTPPRYDPGDWRPGDGVCHAPEISAYSRKLADRIGAILDLGEFPVVLGGDCSIVLGSALAMHRLGEAVGGRIGLVFVDGHSDFRHPGNASYVGAAAGEDLALVTGRGQTDLAAMEGRRPYYRDIDVVVMGIRAQDEYRLDLQAAGIVTRPVPTLRVEGAARSAQWARDQLVDCAGYWVHIDVDVLDPAVMPAVDAPEPGGIAFPELEILLAGLVESPHCLGVEITVFDPDYDPDGKYAEEITSTIVAGLKPAQLVDARPDLVAARRDLAGPGRLGPGRLAPGPQGAPTDAPAARTAVEQGTVEARRAMAAQDGVRLAAAAMSGGGVVGNPEESAVPATTLLGVEESGQVGAFHDAGADSLGPSGADSEPVEADSDDASVDRTDDADADDGDVDDAAAYAGPVDGTGAHAASFDDADADAGPVGDADANYARLAGGGDADVGMVDDAVTDAGSVGDGEQPLDGDASTGIDNDAFAAASSEADDEAFAAASSGADDEAFAAASSGPDDEAFAEVASSGADDEAFAVVDDVRPDDQADADADVAEDADPEPVAAEDAMPDDNGGSPPAEDPASDREPDAESVPGPIRPLGSAPLLDSKPLPATMPGMLRPRAIEDFTLPAQRPAFEMGPEQPADRG